MKGTLKRLGAIFLAAAWLGGCGAYLEGSIIEPKFWEFGGPLSGKENDLAELGLAEMAKGNYAQAEFNFDKAVKANPKDVHALLGLGVLYQNTGRTVRAREMYQAVLALRPANTEQSVVWSSLTPLPVSKIASVNLGLLDSGTPAPAIVFTRSAPAFAGRQSDQAVEHVTQPTMGSLLGQPQQQGGQGGGQGDVVMFTQADVNIASRFRTLMALRDQGLI
ncbi:MAG: tetratricopeptide repeat protein, partial [Rhodospirillales bacterium]|nr:tetratricopeptide repeat protein [Rhodospirillales bacterium]